MIASVSDVNKANISKLFLYFVYCVQNLTWQLIMLYCQCDTFADEHILIQKKRCGFKNEWNINKNYMK